MMNVYLFSEVEEQNAESVHPKLYDRYIDYKVV
jgi:hypothetical protein